MNENQEIETDLAVWGSDFAYIKETVKKGEKVFAIYAAGGGVELGYAHDLKTAEELIRRHDFDYVRSNW